MIAVLFFSLSASAMSEKSLKFDEALAAIIKKSTSVSSQEATLGQTRAAALPARYAFAPSLSFDAKKSWTGDFSSTVTDRKIQAVSQLNLFHWGADWQNWVATDEDIGTEESRLALTRIKVEDDAILALLDEIQRQKEIDIHRQIVEIQEKLHLIAKQRYDSGYLPLQEVEKVGVDLENSKASLADSQLRQMQARQNLARLLGDESVSPEWPWREKLQRTRLQDHPLELSKRPDWRAARSKLSAEEARLSRAHRLMLPSIDGSAAYGWYGDSLTRGWSAELTVTLPFFDHMVSYSNALSQSYVKTRSEAELEQAERDARADFASASASFGISRDAALAREKTVEVSRKLYTDNLKRFQSGRISANDLEIEQRRLFDSELFAVQGWATAHAAFARLCHALGRELKDCE